MSVLLRLRPFSNLALFGRKLYSGKDAFKKSSSDEDDKSPRCVSDIDDDFHDECRDDNLANPLINSKVQAVINEQINRELNAAYTYLSVSHYFARSNVALLGFSKWYKEMSKEETEHANMLAEYLLQRNGYVELHTLKKPPCICWNNLNITFDETIRMENCISESLSNVYHVATKYQDPMTADFIVNQFFREQIDGIRQLNLLQTRWRTLQKAPDGIFRLDREIVRRLNRDKISSSR
ncbi:soma ferritin-like [Uranotaenia lowii]|uniref:soma ferritin-like n=1 Tax=Uranotaenia lowii TaxID=190385 RepID=UPI00247A07A0|nr:soma ferritin-like [Uranotaenia lowii]XP_055598503.1 soma ferritin-like [Uranotaenia lowii]